MEWRVWNEVWDGYGMESEMEYGMESGHCWMGLSEYICSSNPSPEATMPQV